jgi:hypothetical protein
MKTKIDSYTFFKRGILAVTIIAVSGWQIEAQTNITPVTENAAPMVETNSTVEYRMVGTVKNGTTKTEKYDVSKPPFISVTIPAGAALFNAKDIHYNPDAPKPCELVLQIPAIYNSSQPVKMDIRNFPYSPSYFQSGDWQIGYKWDMSYGAKEKNKSVIEKGLVTKEPITLRLFPLSLAKTNFNAMGGKVVFPARPIFDYGKPVK